MTPERLTEIEQLARLYGSSNGWTGTSGMLASVIMELLTYIRGVEKFVNEQRGKIA